MMDDLLASLDINIFNHVHPSTVPWLKYQEKSYTFCITILG